MREATEPYDLGLKRNRPRVFLRDISPLRFKHESA